MPDREREVGEADFESSDRFPHPWYPNIKNPRSRALATLELAFRGGPAEGGGLIPDVIARSTGNLIDFDRQVLAYWLIQRLEEEGFEIKLKERDGT